MIERADGWYWPVDDKMGRRYVPAEAARDIPTLLSHVKQRRLIVQAGGNTGVWAKRLAGEFDRVIAIESDPVNYACLCLNDMPGNVATMHAALASEDGWCRSCMYPTEPNNTAANQAIPNRDGTVRTVRVDQLCLPACDALWLDIEGGELPALWGAKHTIIEHRPVIVLETKGLGASFGWTDADLAEFLSSVQYREAARVARDTVYVPCERPC